MNLANRNKLLKLFETLYPEPASELNFINDFQLIIAVVLSAQCTDKKVNEVTPALFGKYPDFNSLSKASFSQVEKIIRPVNYYKTKARNIIGLAREIIVKFGGTIPDGYKDLISLPGVGNKTANVVLCEKGQTHAFPVDTHVLRLSNRLGLSSGKSPEKVEEDLKKLFKPEKWRELHHFLILHGRRVCKALNPDCLHCIAKKICPSAFRAGAWRGESRLNSAKRALRICASPEQARIQQRFFKTGSGEYGEGDLFLGVNVPDSRMVANAFRDLKIRDIEILLESKVHEERFLALLILVDQFNNSEKQDEIATFYLSHTRWINNWDLVDSSASQIVGEWLKKRRSPLPFLQKLAKSPHLWERRIAIVSTFAFIRIGKLEPTLEVSRALLKDRHDLIHKATGWMLREAGKRNIDVLRGFLKEFSASMPRTALRYAIERMNVKERRKWLGVTAQPLP